MRLMPRLLPILRSRPLPQHRREPFLVPMLSMSSDSSSESLTLRAVEKLPLWPSSAWTTELAHSTLQTPWCSDRAAHCRTKLPFAILPAWRAASSTGLIPWQTEEAPLWPAPQGI